MRNQYRAKTMNLRYNNIDLYLMWYASPAITRGRFQYDFDCWVKYQPECIWTEKADAEKEHGQVAKEHNQPDSEKNYEAVFS